MDPEAESSRPAGGDDSHASSNDDDDGHNNSLEHDHSGSNDNSRLAARRRRVTMLGELLRELDMMVFMQLISVYYLDCSFFWLVVRGLIHGSLLTPTAEVPLARSADAPKPFLPALLFSFGVPFLLHLVCHAPAAGEDTRGYLHGGLMIDFIGQKGPTNKWRLATLDLSILLLQLVMLSVQANRRALKKTLALPAPQSPVQSAAPQQDADDEERGVLHRTDTLSDVGLDVNDDDDGGHGDSDALLPSTPEAAQFSALNTLASGQAVIGHLTLLDTLLTENSRYSSYTLTRSESHVNDMPETLRRLNTLRTQFGVGGG